MAKKKTYKSWYIIEVYHRKDDHRDMEEHIRNDLRLVDAIRRTHGTNPDHVYGNVAWDETDELDEEKFEDKLEEVVPVRHPDIFKDQPNDTRPEKQVNRRRGRK